MMKLGTPWAVEGPGRASMKPGLLGVGVPSSLRSFFFSGLSFLSEPSSFAGGLLAVILRAFSRSWLTRTPLLV